MCERRPIPRDKWQVQPGQTIGVGGVVVSEPFYGKYGRRIRQQVDVKCLHCGVTRVVNICNTLTNARGFCIRCTNVLRRGTGKNIAIDGMKICNRCSKNLVVSEFCSRKENYDGLSFYCKRCGRDKHLRRKYNITIEEYEQMYSGCDGRCQICGVQKGRLVVDHCHKTNGIRGLLCGHCNHMLGKAKDNVVTLGEAIEYLKSYADKLRAITCQS